jgi:hypothetical protein
MYDFLKRILIFKIWFYLIKKNFFMNYEKKKNIFFFKFIINKLGEKNRSF